jgi:hypothetical protein
MENNNMRYWEQFREVPQTAQKKIIGGSLGSMGFTDINPVWRIKKLTEMFGVCGFGWYTKTIDTKFINGANDEISVFVTIQLFVNVDGVWSMPIEGNGGSSFVVKNKNGLKTSDEAIKMATTDALSVCCKMLGIGADIYFSQDKYESKYDKQEELNMPNKASNTPSKQQGLKGWTDKTRSLTRSLITQQLSPDEYNNFNVNKMTDMQLLSFGKIAKEKREKSKMEGLNV